MITRFEIAAAPLENASARRRSTTWVHRLAAALLVCPAAFGPTPAVAATFGEVMQWCSAPLIKGDDKLCSVYITEVLKLLKTPDPTLNGGHQICVPAGDVRQTVIPVMIAWGRQHPEADANDPASAIGEALATRYSCK